MFSDKNDLRRKFGLREVISPGDEFQGFLSPKEVFENITFFVGTYNLLESDYCVISNQVRSREDSVLLLPHANGSKRVLIVGNTGFGSMYIRPYLNDTIDFLNLKHLSPTEYVELVDMFIGKWVVRRHFRPNTLNIELTRDLSGNVTSILKGTRTITINRDGFGVLTGWDDAESEWTVTRDGFGNIINIDSTPK